MVLWRERNITAVFLDRDGVLNRDVAYLCDANQLELLPGAAEAVRMFNAHGILTIVVTNQSGIARGLCTMEQLHAIHDRLKCDLQRRGARLDAIYYCPHHPEMQPGGVPHLCVECECRKPGIGLIRRAQQELGINLSCAVMIGDAPRDIEAGKRAGLGTVLIAHQSSGHHPPPDVVVPSLLDAAATICGHSDTEE
jgi:mannose-1-phosphate guanylyltransferase / phosphomannomutase